MTHPYLALSQFIIDTYQPLLDRLTEMPLSSDAPPASASNGELQQELADTTQQLEATASELEQIQNHLLQMEKMSMLGQMVSGIAHEINNPINFIYGNIPYIEEHVQDLLEVIDVYKEACPPNNEDVEEIEEEVDLEFILEDLPRILGSVKVGAERIRELVLNLRSFYRHDEASMKESDINEGIDTTLVLLYNRYKGNIDVVKNFGEIPPVECYINQLNQVFMNMISNAIDTLLEHPRPEGEKRKIEISTQRAGDDRISVSITDNGAGIPPEVKARLFEPFFTTKPIGVGTGLGLSISRQIVVETHGGWIECDSTPGEGTSFTVELPISQEHRQNSSSDRDGSDTKGNASYAEV